MNGKIVAIVGPSGVGKTTIISTLVDVLGRFEKILSYTTRPPRDYEINGRDYWFVSREEMSSLLVRDSTFRESLLEFSGHLFAMSYSQILSVIASNEVALIELYISRVPEFRKRYGENFSALYLLPPSIEVLKKRLRNHRGHSQAFVEERIEQARGELDLAFGETTNYFDEFLTLDHQLKVAVNQVEQAILRMKGGN